MLKVFCHFLPLALMVPMVLSAQVFEEVSEQANLQAVALDAKLMAGGVVAFDYNNDHYPDLLFVNGDLPVKLYRNDWNGQFTDVTEQSSLLGTAGCMGGVAADFDDDGDLDLFLTTLPGAANRLFRNEGNGRFKEITESAGITHIAYSASATVGDPDSDGDLDIYVTNYLIGENAQDGGQPNFFYRNEGNMTFSEVGESLGLADAGCGLGTTFVDVDADGRQDLYVANDFGYLIEANELYRNEVAGFRPSATRSGLAATINAMGLAKGDYDNDGDTDLYVTNIRENPLFQNENNGAFFRYTATQSGVDLPELTSWGTAFGDFDRDGKLDLVVANGQVAEEVNGPEPMTYFHNEGDGQFLDESMSSGMANSSLIGRGLAISDLDLDGRLDVVVQAVQADITGDERARLLKNTSDDEGHWLSVNVPATALRLELYAGGEVLYRETDGGSSYLSHAAGPVHFGWRTLTGIDSLVAYFSKGDRVVYPELSWDQLLGIRTDGSWFSIAHSTIVNCSTEAMEPLVSSSFSVDGNGSERLLVERAETEIYPRLPAQLVEVSAGEIYQGVARTQDAMIVDTIASSTGCPSLQPIDIRVLPENRERQVYPNPLVKDLTIELNESGGQLQVKVLSFNGATLFEQSFDLASGVRKKTLSFSTLPPGSYLVRLFHDGDVSHHKLIRQ